MYVVRPRSLSRLLGSCAMRPSIPFKYKQELALVREQNIDITHFEEDLDAFQAFARNYNSASSQLLVKQSMKSIRPLSVWKRSRNS